MNTLTTGPNTRSTLTLRTTSMNYALNRWEIVYRITRTTIEPATAMDYKDTTLIIRNTPAQRDEADTIIKPADMALDSFCNRITSCESLKTESLYEAALHAQASGRFVAYEDTTAAMWREMPISDTEACEDWTEGEKVLAGFVRRRLDVKYRALYTHICGSDTAPENSDLWYNADVQRPGFFSRLKNLI